MVTAVTGFVGAMSDLTKLYDKISGGTVYADTLKDLNIDNTTIDLIKANGNMIKFQSKYIVEPPIIITKDAYARNDINALMENVVDVYSAFYLRTFNILTNVNNVKVNEAISLLSTKTDMESYNDVELGEGLTSVDTLGALPVSVTANVGSDLEKISSTTKKEVTYTNDDVITAKTIMRTITLSIVIDKEFIIKNSKMMADETAIKKLTINIPITIKSNVLITNALSVSNGISHMDIHTSWVRRLLQYRVGLISARELLLSDDLAERYKTESLTKDSISAMLNKGASANITIDQLLDKKLGLNKVVFSYIMTDEELSMISKRSGYKHTTNKGKDQLMDVLLALNITSINSDRDIATIYLNGLNGTSSSSIRKLTKPSKGGESSEIIEAMATALLANKPII